MKSTKKAKYTSSLFLCFIMRIWSLKMWIRWILFCIFVWFFRYNIPFLRVDLKVYRFFMKITYTNLQHKQYRVAQKYWDNLNRHVYHNRHRFSESILISNKTNNKTRVRQGTARNGLRRPWRKPGVASGGSPPWHGGSRRRVRPTLWSTQPSAHPNSAEH